MLKLGVRSLLVLAVSAVALGAGATSARSADPQLLDVSRQVAKIQKKMEKLLAKGQTAKGEAEACGGLPSSSQVFKPWGDLAYYALAPQGDLALSTDWLLGKGASVSSEHDPFTPGTKSLRLLSGAEAVTPAICVNQAHPTIRFFARSTGAATSTLSIEVLYQDLKGKAQSLKIAQLKGSAAWSPTIVIPYYVNALAAVSPTGVTAVAFKLKAEGLSGTSAAWTISSLYVDPFVRR